MARQIKTGKRGRSVQSHSRYWSAGVTKHSDALDLESGVFSKKTPRQIALSLKRSAEASSRRKASPYQSAMSMLNFYVNRAGRHLSQSRKDILQQAKGELRVVFGREEDPASRTTRGRPSPARRSRRSD